jgi:hypothetical protein
MLSDNAKNSKVSDPVTSVARYRVRPDRVEEFLDVIDRHWVTLRELELVTDREAEVFLGPERDSGRPIVVEIFEWADEGAAALAHTHPRVSGVWESMGPLCEPREGGGPFEFLDLKRLQR